MGNSNYIPVPSDLRTYNHETVDEVIKTLETGDIILFQEEAKCGSIFRLIDWAIRCCTRSKFSHVGIVVKNPPMGFLNENNEWVTLHEDNQQEDKCFIWDSSKHFTRDPADNRIKFGIALVPAIHYFNNPKLKHQTLYKRSPKNKKTKDKWTTEAIQKLYKFVYNKPYDVRLLHWLAGAFHIIIPKTTDTFWCSAFVTYALCSVGILDEKCTNWTLRTPQDLSSTSSDNNLKWNPGMDYGDDEKIWKF